MGGDLNIKPPGTDSSETRTEPHRFIEVPASRFQLADISLSKPQGDSRTSKPSDETELKAIVSGASSTQQAPSSLTSLDNTPTYPVKSTFRNVYIGMMTEPYKENVAGAAQAFKSIASLVPRCDMIISHCNKEPLIVKGIQAFPDWLIQAMFAVLGDEFCAAYERFVKQLESYFIDEYLPLVSSRSEIALKLLNSDTSETRTQHLIDQLKAIKNKTKEFSAMSQTLVDINIQLEQLLEQIDKTFEAPKPLMDKWRHLTLFGRGVVHDSNNIITDILGNAELAEVAAKKDINSPNVRKRIEHLAGINMDSLESCILLADKFLKNRCEKFTVTLERGDIPHIPIPKDKRLSFFRFLYETRLNSIKYADPVKPNRKSFLGVFKTDSSVRVKIQDNGVGMEVTEARKKRLRPDLAIGTGTGLNSMYATAAANCWQLSIESYVGTGTTVSLEMPLYTLGIDPPASIAQSMTAGAHLMFKV